MRLAVSGYYGAGNLGDEALLSGMLAALRDEGVDHVRVLSANPAATRRLHGVRSVHRGAGLPWALWRAEALVSGGGGLLQDVTSTRSLRYYLGVIDLARRFGRRVVVFGQSLGPLSETGRLAVRASLGGLPIGLRDGPSLRLARELGLSARHVGDTALLLTASAADRRDAVVLVPRSGYPRATTLLADLGRRARDEGIAVEAAAFGGREDRLEVERLRAAVPDLRLLAAEEPGAMVTALAGARLVVSARLHGLVLAAAGGTPHAALSYDPKVEGFATETGAAWWPVPADGAEHDRTLEALGVALARPSFDAERVATARDRALDGVRWLAREALRGPPHSA
ncbi:MAG: polysaccharide pyruvyl transferase CsaB [Trueperaceae bacterium]|nr:polysaccharide pyruvyl transferase CsaB [Trueperaceae bacterium]